MRDSGGRADGAAIRLLSAYPSITATYDVIARLIGGRSDEVALFDNATHAWNAAFCSVPLRPGDQILTGRAEYGSNVLAYWQVASRTGAEAARPASAHRTAALAPIARSDALRMGSNQRDLMRLVPD